ncbi:MAG: DUF364 domain-containing protein [Calditrichaeota bacterium]|nr:DUF364 domain-containing protein [Calditrichota bacterium]
MKILHDLVNAVDRNFPVKDVQVGLHWTAVVSRFCGLASSLIDPPPHQNHKISDAGRLHQKSIGELSALIFSASLSEASVGLAALNSLIEIDESKCEPINAFEIIAEKGTDRTIGIIGHFPFVSKLKTVAKKVYVFEKRLQEGDLPASEIENKLPECDIVAISATTLINHTLENVLSFCRKDALKIMLGASTPMLELLFDYGLDVLAGSKVENPEEVLMAVRQGATFKQIHGIKLLARMRK